jgi:predicted NBD/HSP70 family sugar kinase
VVIDRETNHLTERNPMATLWAGIDAGKQTHHCVVIDRDGAVVLSKKIGNEEDALVELIAGVIELAD